MRVPVSSALRAELRRARHLLPGDRIALLMLALDDDGDLSAWELALQLMPERLPDGVVSREGVLLVGAAPMNWLVRTLHSAGERELSAALSATCEGAVPVVRMQDVLREVTVLDALVEEEADSLLFAPPAGYA
ncbi:MAG: hypothetical protein IPK82_19105 [Polyangiaceae bacterium]|nr:hypothetical protein [Polyangiaceae bacterium]